MKPEKSLNYSLLAAINKERLVAYMITKGAVVTEIYTYFISRLIDIFAKEKSINNTVFIDDGNRSHCSIFLKRIFLNKKNFERLPPLALPTCRLAPAMAPESQKSETTICRAKKRHQQYRRGRRGRRGRKIH